MGGIPFAAPMYREGGDRISEILARQGENAARGALMSGQAWGNAVGQLGQIAGQAVQQYGEAKEMKKRDAALQQFIESGAWQDPQQAVIGATRILGPRDGPRLGEALIGAAKLSAGTKDPAESRQALQMIARGWPAVPAALRPAMWSNVRQLAGGAGMEIPEQYTPELDPMIAEFGGQAKPAEGFSLSPGQKRFDAQGKVIAEAPAEQKATTLDQQLAAAYRANDQAEVGRILGLKAREAAATRAPQQPPSDRLTLNQEALETERLAAQWKAAAAPGRALQRQVDNMDLGLAAARRGDMAAGAQAVLVTFQKILDPESVVRESEYARSAEGQALMSRMQGALEKLQKGGAGVPVADLEKFAELARGMARAQQGRAEGTRKRIKKVAERYKIPTETIFDDAEPAAPPAGVAPAAPKVGDRKTFPNGRKGVWDGQGWAQE
jgi:hypothetical protein